MLPTKGIAQHLGVCVPLGLWIVCPSGRGSAGHSMARAWLGYSFQLGHVGGDVWSKHKWLGMLKHEIFPRYCSGEKSRNGAGPAGKLKAGSMLQVDVGWKSTISGLVPECMVLEIQVCCKKSFICFTYCWASQRCHRLTAASSRWAPEQKTIQPSQTRFTLSTMPKCHY